MKIFRYHISCILGIFSVLAITAQGKKSKGDAYYFQYAYQQAISAYEDEMVKDSLSSEQKLNLADSYFKTDAFSKASKLYFESYKNDSLMNNHHFNKMLQSFSRTGNQNRVIAVLGTKSLDLSQELIENADFNLELLNSGNQENQLDFEVFNIESNSPQSDFAPSFYGEDKLLFSSGRPQEKRKNYAPMNESYLNIYVSRINGGNQVLNPNIFEGVPPSKYHKATPYYSDALKSVLYVLSNTDNGNLTFDQNGKNALAIGLQKLNGSFRMVLKDLSTSFYYPFYDDKSGKLYFAANFDDGYGGTDLYYMHTNNGQVMSAPINLGPRINSPGNEIAPYIFENSLYFSSDVFYGIGGMDIYRSNIEDGDSYSIPVNLGPKVNSEKDDFGFIMRNQGEGLLGYFSSNRAGGKGKDDIYGFNVAQKPGLKTITLKGVVYKPFKNNEGIERATVRLLDANGSVLKEVYSNEDGEYRIEIPWRENVVLQSQKDRHSLYTKKLEFLTGQDQETSFDVDIDMASYNDLVEEKEGQNVVKLGKFFFDRNKSTITDEIKKELDKVVDFAKRFPQAQLRIETYTDSRGGSSTNYRLTKSRSDAIKKYLVDNGVPSTQIPYSMGFGEEKLLNNCHNGAFCIELMHRQNQRSLIVILNDNLIFE